jgi:hypothetical protein
MKPKQQPAVQWITSCWKQKYATSGRAKIYFRALIRQERLQPGSIGSFPRNQVEGFATIS